VRLRRFPQVVGEAVSQGVADYTTPAAEQRHYERPLEGFDVPAERGLCLVSALAAEPHTPLEQAVRTTLNGLGCLS